MGQRVCCLRVRQRGSRLGPTPHGQTPKDADMVGSVLVGMLCAHLLCFAVMFLLISKRLQGKKMGMDFFAMGNLLLGLAYVLQLVEGGPAWSMMSVVNHTLTLAAPITYGLGVMRFFGFPAPLWRPLAAFVLAYSTAQALIQWSLGPVARYAMLSGMSALLFLVMTLAALYGVRTFAKHLYRGNAVFSGGGRGHGFVGVTISFLGSS